MIALTDDLVDLLLSERGRAALAALGEADLSEAAELTSLMALRRHFAPAEAAALLDQARLRQAACLKFPDAERLFFTEEALQQASSAQVAHYRAQYFRPYRRVADLGCGIGGDTLALAEVAPEVLAVERDPLRARLAVANVAARGLSARVTVLCADWTRLALDVEAAFADPSRRVEGRRVFHLAQLEPPLEALLALARRVPNVAIKAPPGIDDAEIPAEAEVEFISERGTLKEALLLFGDLRRGVPRSATLLPGPHRLEGPEPNLGVGVPGAFLYEPDPAVLRATLVRALGARLGAWLIDPEIAYLTSDTLQETPFARAWRVLRHGPFGLKALNRWLRELGAGAVVVKKRGSPIEPDAFVRRLKTLPGGAPLTVFLTRAGGRPWMLVAAEITRQP
jgi:SAM-dependent methyltransferase